MFEYELMTDEQKEYVGLVRKFVDKELIPVAAHYDEIGETPMDVYRKAGELELYGFDVPAEYGGLGLETSTIFLLREEFARGDAGFASLFGSSIGYRPILVGGTEEQKHEYGERVVKGEICSLCLTEPDCGSDLASLKTTAVKCGDEYILNGTKRFVTNGGHAGFYTVLAVTDKEKGSSGGVSAFIVERDWEGVSVGKEENKIGLRLSNTVDMNFDNVRVPAKNLLGAEGQGFKYVMKMLDHTRPCAMMPAIGIMRAALEHSVQYAKERKTFGTAIGNHQGVSFMLANMYAKLQSSRQMALHCAKLVDEGKGHSMMSSACKLHVGEAVQDVCRDAIQIFGGYGLSREYPVEKLYRDAKVFSIFEGTSQVQQMVIGRNLMSGKG